MEKRTTIMIVDDDQDLLKLLQRVLEKEGYDVIKAGDGNSAIALLEDRIPDLIILDIIMPGIDGYQVLEMIRKRMDVPVIMLTAKRESSSVHDALTAGADDYIRKPFSTVELLARVKAKLRRSE